MNAEDSVDRTVRAIAIAFSLLIVADCAHAHAGPVNKLAVKACIKKVKSQACQYEGAHRDLYKGTCQHMAEHLMCVRNQPIQKKPQLDMGIFM